MKAIQRRLDHLVVVDASLEDYGPLVAELDRHTVRIGLFATAEAALQASAACASTLWVVNIRLPDMSGIGLLKLVRRRQKRSSVFLVGDEYSADDELAARSAGATAYVCKPPSAAWLEVYQPHCDSTALAAGDSTGLAAGDSAKLAAGCSPALLWPMERKRGSAATMRPP